MPIKLPLIASSLPAVMAQKKQAAEMARAMEEQAGVQSANQRNAWLAQQAAASQANAAAVQAAGGSATNIGPFGGGMGQIMSSLSRSSPQTASLQASPQAMSQAANASVALPQFAAVSGGGSRSGMAQAIGGHGQAQTLGGEFPRIGGHGQGQLIGNAMARIGGNGQARGFTAPNTELGLFANEPARPGVGVPRPAGAIARALAGVGAEGDVSPQAQAVPQGAFSPPSSLFPARGMGVGLPNSRMAKSPTDTGMVPAAVSSFQENFPGLLGQITGQGSKQGPGLSSVDISPQQSMLGTVAKSLGMGSDYGLSPSNFDNQLGGLLGAWPSVADSMRGPLASHLSSQMQTPGQQQTLLGQLGHNPNTMSMLGIAPNVLPGSGPNLLSFGPAQLPGVGQVAPQSLPGVTMPGFLGGGMNGGIPLGLPFGAGAMPGAQQAGGQGFGGIMAAAAMAGAAAAQAAIGGAAQAAGGGQGGSASGGGGEGSDDGGESGGSGGGSGGGGK